MAGSVERNDKGVDWEGSVGERLLGERVSVGDLLDLVESADEQLETIFQSMREEIRKQGLMFVAEVLQSSLELQVRGGGIKDLVTLSRTAELLNVVRSDDWESLIEMCDDEGEGTNIITPDQLVGASVEGLVRGWIQTAWDEAGLSGGGSEVLEPEERRRLLETTLERAGDLGFNQDQMEAVYKWWMGLPAATELGDSLSYQLPTFIKDKFGVIWFLERALTEVVEGEKPSVRNSRRKKMVDESASIGDRTKAEDLIAGVKMGKRSNYLSVAAVVKVLGKLNREYWLDWEAMQGEGDDENGGGEKQGESL